MDLLFGTGSPVVDGEFAILIISVAGSREAMRRYVSCQVSQEWAKQLPMRHETRVREFVDCFPAKLE